MPVGPLAGGFGHRHAVVIGRGSAAIFMFPQVMGPMKRAVPSLAQSRGASTRVRGFLPFDLVSRSSTTRTCVQGFREL